MPPKKAPAKAAAKKSVPQQSPLPSTEPTLALSDLHLRLAGLEKENEKLLKQIAKKRKEIDTFLAKGEEIGQEVVTRGSGFMTQIAEVDQEIHRTFKQIFTTRKMGKATAQMVEEVYFELQAGAAISTNPKHRPRSFLEEILGLDRDWEEQVEAEFGPSSGGRYYDQPPEETETVAVNREESRKIRQTFLRLASVFHPDKILDAEQSAEYAEVMKEINLAYQRGDLARLLEIEKQYEVGAAIDLNSSDDLTLRCQQLARENELLKEQQLTLKQEMRQAKASEPGRMVQEYQKLSKQGINPIDELMIETQRNLENMQILKDFVQSFLERKITVAQFKRGPKLKLNNNYFDIDDLEDMVIFVH